MGKIMKQCIAFALLGVLSLPAVASAQQSSHKFLYRAELTIEGVKDLQKRTAVGLRANIIKATESAGCKQEYWYFDPLTSVAFGGVDCQSEMAPAALVTAVNAAGFAKLSYWAVLTAEQMDGLLSKAPNVRAPQNQ
jgi:hypothetical protein